MYGGKHMGRYVLAAALLSAVGVVAVIAITQMNGSGILQRDSQPEVGKARNMEAEHRGQQSTLPTHQDRASAAPLKPVQVEPPKTQHLAGIR
jgi:hypothetical protein